MLAKTKSWRLARVRSEDVASSSSSSLFHWYTHNDYLHNDFEGVCFSTSVDVKFPSYIDSPLSRSPGSSVFIGVGLPMTRPSSALGGLHRVEYCCTPPHSSSPPVFAPLLLLLLLLPLLLLFQWDEWPIGWDAPELAPPILVWLVPGVACQLVVPPSNWPCAKKRFTSSSPANSARMVVFPSTHLGEENKKKKQNKQMKFITKTTMTFRQLWEAYMCRDFWALAASSLEL